MKDFIVKKHAHVNSYTITCGLNYPAECYHMCFWDEKTVKLLNGNLIPNIKINIEKQDTESITYNTIIEYNIKITYMPDLLINVVSNSIGDIQKNQVSIESRISMKNGLIGDERSSFINVENAKQTITITNCDNGNGSVLVMDIDFPEHIPTQITTILKSVYIKFIKNISCINAPSVK